MASAPIGSEQFSFGRVFGGIFSPIRKNWMPLLAFSAAAHFVSAAVSAVGSAAFIRNFRPGDTSAVWAMYSSPKFWVMTIIGLLLASFTQSGLIHGLLQSDADRQVSFGDCVGAGVRKMLPYFGLCLLWGMGVGFGYILLVVPAMILLSIWAVCAPALVAEDVGIIDAFGRSAALTNGHRWPIFGCLLLFAVAYFLVSFGAQGFSTSFMLKLMQTSYVLAMAFSFVISTVTSLVLTGFLASLYRETRIVNEGVGSHGLAAVFS